MKGISFSLVLRTGNFFSFEEIHSQVESQMSSGKAKVVEFWEVVLKGIHIYKAKVSLIIYTSGISSE